MKPASALLCVLAFAAGAAEKPEPAEAPKEKAIRELLVGAPMSDRKRDNVIKRWREVQGWDPKALEKALAVHREKAREANAREAKKALEAALLAKLGNAEVVEGLMKQAGKAREEWEALRQSGTPEAERLRKGEGGERAGWLRRRGFNRPGTDALAEAYVFSDEAFVPVPKPVLDYLAALGFDAREAEILLFELELREQVELRMAAAKAP